jgi:hypothetical protein
MFAVAIASTCAFAGTPDNRVLVDMEARSIASVHTDTTVKQLQAEFGSANVVEGVETLEGDKSPLVIVTVDGHKVFKHWNHISTQDPAFRTREGLGVGSTVAAFERVFGPAARGEGEGGWYINFLLGKSTEFQVRVTPACFGNDGHLNDKDPGCIVRELLL